MFNVEEENVLPMLCLLDLQDCGLELVLTASIDRDQQSATSSSCT